MLQAPVRVESAAQAATVGNALAGALGAAGLRDTPIARLLERGRNDGTKISDSRTADAKGVSPECISPSFARRFALPRSAFISRRRRARIARVARIRSGTRRGRSSRT